MKGKVGRPWDASSSAGPASPDRSADPVLAAFLALARSAAANDRERRAKMRLVELGTTRDAA